MLNPIVSKEFVTRKQETLACNNCIITQNIIHFIPIMVLCQFLLCFLHSLCILFKLLSNSLICFSVYSAPHSPSTNIPCMHWFSLEIHNESHGYQCSLTHHSHCPGHSNPLDTTTSCLLHKPSLSSSSPYYYYYYYLFSFIVTLCCFLLLTFYCSSWVM